MPLGLGGGGEQSCRMCHQAKTSLWSGGWCALAEGAEDLMKYDFKTGRLEGEMVAKVIHLIHEPGEVKNNTLQHLAERCRTAVK